MKQAFRIVPMVGVCEKGILGRCAACGRGKDERFNCGRVRLKFWAWIADENKAYAVCSTLPLPLELPYLITPS